MKYALLGALLLFFGGLFAKVTADDARAYRANEARAIAEQLTVASGSVRSLAASTGLADGELAHDDIPRPSWLELPVDLRVRTQGAVTYVYYIAENSAQAARILGAVEERTAAWVGFTAGRNVNRELIRSTTGAPITLPDWMPDDAVVIVI